MVASCRRPPRGIDLPTLDADAHEKFGATSCAIEFVYRQSR
jgi:hypothetical protein